MLDPWSPRETQDFYDCIEWAGSAVVVQRQGRPERHLVFRDECSGRWRPAAAASRRDLRLGGRGRPLPRGDPPRRHVSRISLQLVPRAVHRVQHGLGERGPASRVTGEPVWGHENLPRKSCSETGVDYERLHARASRSTTRAAASARPTGRRSRCRFSRPPTGAGRGCIRAAISRASCARLRATSGSRRTAARTGELLFARRPAAAEAVLRPLPEGRGHRLDARSRACELKIRHPGEKFVVRHENEWPLERTRWTRFYLNPAQMSLDRSEPGLSKQLSL